MKNENLVTKSASKATEKTVMVKKPIRAVIAILTAFILFQYFYSGSPNDVLPKDNFEIVAHRGVHQTTGGQKGEYHRIYGCEATLISKPRHEYIENTIESMEAAFSYGATIVEFDIRLTSDNQLVVFHDWMLECKTDGKGRVNEYPLEQLKRLDIAYGYTYDDGKTYPLRGKGIGKMPTLIEVLRRFPDKKFLINQKNDSMKTAELLVDIVKSLSPEQQSLLYYWGPDKTYEYIHEEVPEVTRLFGTRPQIKKWLITYLLTFGLSGFPEESRDVGLGIPAKYTKYAWGWPYRFLKYINEAGARFYLVIDSEENARRFPDIPLDGIVTDHIEIVGKYFKK